MSAAQIAGALFPLSMFLIVLALGLRTTFSAATYLFREPRLLGRSVAVMYLVVPVAVLAIVMVVDLHPAVKVALVALSVSPVPPVLPVKELKLVGRERETYVFGLLVATCVLAIAIVPAAVTVLSPLFGIDLAVDEMAIARIVAITALAPLAAGLALRRWMPASAGFSGAISAAGVVALLLALALLLPRVWPALPALAGDGTLIAIVGVTAIALAAGHLLGGPTEDDRTVLALSASMRHPAVAIVVALQTEQTLAPAAVLLALLVAAVATAPYTAWRKGARTEAPAGPSETRSR